MALQTIATHTNPASIPWIGVSIKRARGNHEERPDHIITDDHNIALAKEVGAKILRVDVMWDRCERKRGVYDFSSVQPLIEKAWAKGMMVLPILARGNSLYTGAWNKPPITDEAWIAFANFAVAAGKTLGVPFLEAMNEPNNGQMWGGPPDPVSYGKGLNQILLAMKAAGITKPIIAGGMAIGGQNGFIPPKDFISAALPYVTATNLAAWGLHPYTGADTYLSDPMMRPENVQARMRGLMPDGVRTPFFNTEQGYSATECTGKTKDEKQARQAVYGNRFILSALTGWQMAIWYDLVDDGRDINNPEENYGLYDFDLKLKPVGTAFRSGMSLIGACSSVIVRKDGDRLQGNFTMPGGDAITIEAAQLQLQPSG